MSDEFERRLRDAGHRLPGPAPEDTLAARAGFLDAVPAARRRLPRRGPALALAAALAVAGAFGVGYALAAGGAKTVTRTRVVHVKARLDAGPGFLPADGWTTGVTLDPRTGAIVSATAAGAAGTRIEARFAPASSRHGLQERTLPLQLPDGGRTRTLSAAVGAYAVDVVVRLPSARAAAAVLAAAREELGRLVVPACPAALPLRGADADAARRYVLGWLPAHYAGDAAEVVGATATAAAGARMPRHGQAAADCGATVAARSVEVDVTLPRLAKVSASLSQLTYFVARTAAGWRVWERAR